MVERCLRECLDLDPTVVDISLHNKHQQQSQLHIALTQAAAGLIATICYQLHAKLGGSGPFRKLPQDTMMPCPM